MSWSDARRTISASAIVVLAAGLAVCLYIVQPGEARIFPPCPFHAASGLYCPGCGTLRALYQLVHGDVCGACRSNILAIVLLPIPLYDIVFRSAAAGLRRPLRQLIVRPMASWAIVAVTVLYWIARNVPAYPFTLLAPQ